MAVFCKLLIHFHPILLKLYRHVQNDLAQKRKFLKMGFGVQKFFLKLFFWKNDRFLRTTHSFFIRSFSNFIGMCRMTLPKNVNFQKRVLGSKHFLKKLLFSANYSFIFLPMLLKLYRHVLNDLAQKLKFSKMFQNFPKKIFL